MDEDSYRDISGGLRRLGCVFEKPILQRLAGCGCCRKINIAEREVADCRDLEAHNRCLDYLAAVRGGSRFALGDPSEPPSFNRAVQLQTGAVNGLARLLAAPLPVEDIGALVERARQNWPDAEEMPMEAIVRAIAQSKRTPRVRKNRPRS